MAKVKDFTSSRAASRVKRLSEDEVVFGREQVAPAGEEETTHAEGGKKRELTHQVTVLLDDELFYRMKVYLAHPGTRWRSASVMLRELLEAELGKTAEEGN